MLGALPPYVCGTYADGDGEQAPGTTLYRSPINGMQPPPALPPGADGPPLLLDSLTLTFRLSLLTVI